LHFAILVVEVANPSHFDVDISAVYSCTGDGCGFRFDLSNARRDVGGGFAEAFRRFYAAFQLHR
jgi:hypothetical protein